MKTLTEYLEEQEEQEMLEEGILNIMGKILGISTVGVLYAWAGAMLLKGGIGAVNSIAGTFGKKGIDFKNGFRKAAKDSPSIKHELSEMDKLRNKYGAEIMDVTVAIKQKDWEKAAYAFKELSIEQQNSTEIKKIIIEDIIQTTKQVPVSEPTPGNECYKALRRIFGMASAKAITKVFQEQAQKMASIGE